MSRLLLGRKRQLAVIAQFQQTPSDNGHPVNAPLPTELWEYIAKFLDLEDLSRLYFLNQAFYDAFLCCKFRCVTLHIPNPRSCNFQKELALLRNMQNPHIKKKIRILYFHSEWEANLMSALDSEGWKSYFPSSWSRLTLSMRGRMEKVKHQAIRETIHGAISKFTNVTHLSVYLGPLSNLLILRTVWTACLRALNTLTLHLDTHPLASDHPFPLGITCPNLRTLHIVPCLPYPELLTELRTLIPEDGGCMEELTICQYRCQLPMLNASFESLKRLVLDGDHTVVPSFLTFIAHHRDTLQEISLGRIPSNGLRNLQVLNTGILTTLSVFIDPFLRQQDEMFPFLSRCTCLRILELLHCRHMVTCTLPERMPSFIKLLYALPPSITHLTFPGLVLDFPIFLSISQQLPNITSLTLSDCYPANEEIGVHFSHPGSDYPKGLTPSWLFVFGGQLQTRLTTFTQVDLCESLQEAISKVFLGSITCLCSCCSQAH